MRGHEYLTLLLSTLLITVLIGVPVWKVLRDAAVPVIPGFILIMVTSIAFLKMVSYVHVNWDLRYPLAPHPLIPPSPGPSSPLTSY